MSQMVHAEEPFAAVVANKYEKVVCSSCFSAKGPLIPCVDCAVLHYCSSECYENDAIYHQHECSRLKTILPLLPSSNCRLVARIVFKVRREESLKKSFNGRQYFDLSCPLLVSGHLSPDSVDPSDEARASLSLKRFNEFLSNLKEYMGDDFINDEPFLMSVFGKVEAHAIDICALSVCVGSGLYIGLSAHKHSCLPSATLSVEGSIARLIMRGDAGYSTDVTVSKIWFLSDKTVRQIRLDKFHIFRCECLACEDETLEAKYSSAKTSCACNDSYCTFNQGRNRFECVRCETPSKFTVDQINAALEGARILCASLSNGKDDHDDRKRHRKHLESTRRKYSRIFSSWNLCLLQIGEQLFDMSVRLRNSKYSWFYAGIIERVYKKYLKLGDPELSKRMHLIFVGLWRLDSSNKKLSAFFCRVLKCIKASHGTQSYQYTEFRRMRKEYMDRRKTINNI